MNKNRYRIVFNSARGQSMAVPETASSHQPESGDGASPAVPPFKAVLAVLRPLVLSLFAALGMLAITPSVQAQVVVDSAAPAAQQPMLTSTANGTPLVNIQTPSAAGVSRNTYTQFDIGQQGAILNNARTNAQTQLGGWIQGNPYLAGGTARVILNEVNAANPSQLLGYIEVGGDRAQVVIANPAGITCDGCGFINANRATLTTGLPLLSGGNLDGYRVQQGQITVQGNGLDASQADFTDLIARAVQVNAGVWAQQLAVTAGANQVNADNTLATPIAGINSAPAVAIDVAALGGMYANKIVLVGTEAGVGVRNAGQIGAAAGDIQITADGLLINSGTIGSNSRVQIDTGTGVQNSGTLYAGTELRLDTRGNIDNSGEVSSLGDATLNATGINSQIINAQLINAGGTLNLLAARVDNRYTQGANQGIQAESIHLVANQIDNIAGAMSADTAFSIVSAGSLDNTQGLISAGGVLDVRDTGATKTLAVSNTGGVLIAGQTLQLDAAQLSGTGKLRSQGDLTVALSSNTLHTGEIAANYTATVAIAGTLVNQGSLQAGQALNVSAAGIDNTASGELNAATTTVTTSGLLTNRGLIDGINTRINAGTFTNTGSGRVFGDTLAIATTTLNNTSENGTAAVIAARTQLDIGVQTLSNQNRALIYSDGDLAIGGTLDSSGQATGQAALIVNNGATIEAQGTLQINALVIHNLNANLAVQQVSDPTSYQEYVQPVGSATQFAITDCWGIGGGQDTNGCAGYPVTFEDYTWLKVNASPSHTEVLSTQPGQLFAGGGLYLTGGSLLNQDSHIVAGGLLDISTASVSNLATQGQDITTYNGTAQFTKIVSCGTFGNKHCRDWNSATAYNPAADYGAPYNLPTTELAQNTAPAGSGTSLTAAGNAPVVGGPGVATLPTSSLYQLNPDPLGSYLIETAPRFASYKNWLSSDYLLSQLGTDPALMQKRLGDGFYEQKLIRDQILQLTGRRFLDGYANDEAQYQALMRAGLTYAQSWRLVPGIALSAEQIAQLTSDIVWLVEQQITLADGSTQRVLVPQVYVSPRSGDLNGDGSLLAGQQIKLNLSADASTGTGGTLTNSGTIAGRTLVQIDSANLNNLGGRITGRDLALNAQQDLRILGGSIDAQNSLIATAGRDLTVASTTRSSENLAGQSRFSQTSIERVAGLYVSGPAGVLIASAGRDLSLTGAVIANSGAGGQTLIDTGNDLVLGSLTTARQNNIVWDAKNHLNQGNTQDIGSVIQTQGDLTLQAGNDIRTRAAQLTSTTGAVDLQAGRDIKIEAGEASQNWSEARYDTKRGFLSRNTSTRLDSQDATQAIASTLSGQTVSLTAKQDIAINGSSIDAQNGVALLAGNTLSVTAAENTRNASYDSSVQKSGLTTSGYSTRNATEIARQTEVTHSGSSIRTQNGDIVLAANLNQATDTNQGIVWIEGSQIVADAGKVDISGKHILVTASEDQSSSERTLNESNSTWAFNTGLPTGKKRALDSRETSISLNSSTIAGTQGVALDATGLVDITAARLAASDGDIRISGSDVSIQSGLDRSQTDLKEGTQKTGVNLADLSGLFKPGEGMGFKSTLTTANAQSTLVPTTLDARNIAIQSTQGDISLTAVAARAERISLDAANDLKLASVTTSDYQSTDLKKKDLAWQSVKGNGSLDETTRYTQLNAEQLNLSAGNRITVDMSVKDSAAVLATEAGMGWLKQLQADPSLNNRIDWQSIQEAHQKWDYKQQGLTPAAAAVIAIVVAYFTAGAGTAAIGTTTTAVGGASATAVGGTALAATTAAGVTTYTATGILINTAVSTLASKAAVSLINNGGRLDKTLKELGSKDNLRDLAVSLVTAGALNSLGNSITIDGTPLNKITVEHSFAANVGKNLINGLTRATVNSAITGTDLETSLRTEIIASILNAASAKGANWVGGQAGEGGRLNNAGQVNEFGRAVAHAVVGCIAGAAGSSASNSGISGGSACGAGALGAVVGELSAQLYNNGRAEGGLLPKTDTVQFASMMSGIAAAVAGQDAQGVAIAAATGANAAENNFLSHQLQARRELFRKLIDSGRATESQRAELGLLEQIDQRSDELLAKWKANPNSLNSDEVQTLAVYVGAYAQQAGEAKARQLFGPQAMLSGAFSNYGFPYAGSQEAQDAYMAANPLSWKERLLGRNDPNYNTYRSAISQSMVYGQHQAQADLGNTILLGSSKTLMLAASAFELGKGGAALVDGEYATGIMHTGLGLLGMTGAYAVGRPVGGIANDKGVLGAKSVEVAVDRALVDTRKFTDYIFTMKSGGKEAVFKSLGYTVEDTAALAKTWQTQAAEKFAKGEYTLGKLDQYGQRINIEIALPGKSNAVGQTSYLKSGWMVQPDGTIKLNTPFSGFTRSGK